MSLFKTLESIDYQTMLPKEVIIIDSSDDVEYLEGIDKRFPRLNFKVLHSEPSVCIQRNIGIREASSYYIFLCDDDIDPEKSYISTLVGFLESNPDEGAVSGLIVQKEADGKWYSQYPFKYLSQLLGAFVFQHSVWGRLDKIKLKWYQKLIYSRLYSFYNRNKNQLSYAGWPVVTSLDEEINKAAVYGLGASIIKKSWLLNDPYDETLDPSGIGDNYGVCMSFPKKMPINIIKNSRAYHNKIGINRLPSHISFYRRTLALHYFISKSSKKRILVFFYWSIIGHILIFLFKRNLNFLTASIRVFRLTITKKNPYVIASKKGKRVVTPVYP